MILLAKFLRLFIQTTSLLRARMLYERLVTMFPTSGRYWRLYIEHEVNTMWIIWCSVVLLHVNCRVVSLCIYLAYAYALGCY